MWAGALVSAVVCRHRDLQRRPGVEAQVMARKVRLRRRTQAEIAEANAIKTARAADTELYRDECSVCGRTIPKEFVLSGQSTRTTCGGRCALKSMQARAAGRQP